MEGRAAQAEIYGEPLGDILSRCGRALGLNQSRLAEILGISAPMLSQLANGHRVKVGNPVAALRLQVMNDAVEPVERGDLSVEDALARISRVQGGGEILTTRRSSRSDAVAEVQDLFRRVAGASDYLAAADLIAQSHPEISVLLRTYGAGRTAEAQEHLARLRGTPTT